MLKKIHETIGWDIESNIIDQQTIDPLRWQDDLNLCHGSALGLNHNIFQTGWFRSSPLTPYDNIYVIGSNVQLGIGVPTCMLSGLFLHDMILQKNKKQSSTFGTDINKLVESFQYYHWVLWIIVYNYLKDNMIIVLMRRLIKSIFEKIEYMNK